MEGTPGENRKGPGCSPAVTLLHATDLRYVPLILTPAAWTTEAEERPRRFRLVSWRDSP